MKCAIKDPYLKQILLIIAFVLLFGGVPGLFNVVIF